MSTYTCMCVSVCVCVCAHIPGLTFHIHNFLFTRTPSFSTWRRKYSSLLDTSEVVTSHGVVQYLYMPARNDCHNGLDTIGRIIWEQCSSHLQYLKIEGPRLTGIHGYMYTYTIQEVKINLYLSFTPESGSVVNVLSWDVHRIATFCLTVDGAGATGSCTSSDVTGASVWCWTKWWCHTVLLGFPQCRPTGSTGSSVKQKHTVMYVFIIVLA